ncbi:hypothetical protein Tco_1020167 [Tanacetum coccineum]|uniref:Uncharacterized protein n=1 Tax=Tanacetum coccineum TaxID=301880 RepID=A0ABQ5FZD0_9ASTR
MEAAKTLSKVASQRSKSVDKGKRYKRRKESKGKYIDTGFEDIGTGFEEVNTGGLGVSTSSGPVSSARGQREGKAPMIVEETQAPKRNKEQIKQEKLVELVNQRKKFFAEERAKVRRSKPMTQSLLRNYMMNYLKNQETWKLTQLKKLSFEEVKEEFDKLVKQVESFVPINIKATKAQVGKRKKQKARKGISINKSPQGDSEADKEELVEAMNPTPLDTKSNIVANWKIFQQGERSIYQIIRANEADTVYMSFGAMLKDFIREDLIELYRLVMHKYGTNRPEDAYDRVLWSDLKTMFDLPLNEDAIWSLPLQKKMISWRYYDSCSIPVNRGLIQAIPTSLPPQPIGEATKASNLQRVPPECVEMASQEGHDGITHSRLWRHTFKMTASQVSLMALAYIGSGTSQVLEEKEIEEDVDDDELDRIGNEDPTRWGKYADRLMEMPILQLIGYYLKHEINKKTIKDIVNNHKYNDALLTTRLGKNR